MARQTRIEYAGAMYHVMARGNRREIIFRDDEDRKLFINTLGDAAKRCGWRVHAWVLMGNHYHMVLETPEANLSAGMKWLHNAYTRRYNVKHRLWGHLFGGRYRAILVEQPGRATRRYYAALLDYVHLNPVRGGLVRDKQSLLSYQWSSLVCGYAVSMAKRSEWMEVRIGLGAFELNDDTKGRRKFVERLEERRLDEEIQKCGYTVIDEQRLNSRLDRGWYWGSERFKEKMLKHVQAVGLTRNNRYDAAMKEHGESTARELIAKGLKYYNLKQAELLALKGADKRKAEIAWQVFQNTTVGQKWIAKELCMLNAANVSQILAKWRKRQHANRTPEWIKIRI